MNEFIYRGGDGVGEVIKQLGIDLNHCVGDWPNHQYYVVNNKIMAAKMDYLGDWSKCENGKYPDKNVPTVGLEQLKSFVKNKNMFKIGDIVQINNNNLSATFYHDIKDGWRNIIKSKSIWAMDYLNQQLKVFDTCYINNTFCLCVEETEYGRDNYLVMPVEAFVLWNHDMVSTESTPPKTIIGYKAPFNMFKGEIKQGMVYELYYGNDSMYVPRDEDSISQNKSYYSIPKEIVEQWEPAYEEDELIPNFPTIKYNGTKYNGELTNIGVKYGCQERTFVKIQKLNDYIAQHEILGTINIGEGYRLNVDEIKEIYSECVRLGKIK